MRLMCFQMQIEMRASTTTEFETALRYRCFAPNIFYLVEVMGQRDMQPTLVE